MFDGIKQKLAERKQNKQGGISVVSLILCVIFLIMLIIGTVFYLTTYHLEIKTAITAIVINLIFAAYTGFAIYKFLKNKH